MKYLKLLLALALCVCSVSMAMAYTEREVTIVNPQARISLAGTLTIPEQKPKAVVVLATGSGQQDRDEEIMGHRPFKAIADLLGSKGYAVLRLDDRGAGKSEGNFAKATADDFVSDIKAALCYVDTTFTEIPKGVLGHSEGGSTAIRCADRCNFIITLAAPAWQGDSIIMSQSRALAVGTLGKWENEPLQRKILDIAKGQLPSAIAKAMIVTELAKSLGNAAYMPEVKQQMNAQTDIMVSQWYRQMLRYNPEADIKAVAVPWLALNGDKDTQVLPGNLTTIAKLSPTAETVTLPAHNHLFLECTTGLVTEYQSLTGDISDLTLHTIANWLDKQFK